MHDGIALEAKGVPTAVIVTVPFLHEATVQRAALGMADLTPVVIAHPLSTLKESEIAARAAGAAGQVEAVPAGT